MKRIITFLLLLLLFLPENGQTETKYFTVREVHDEVESQYPDGWHETIQTKWRTIEINTPVIVPDADQCPVLALQVIEEHPDFAALSGEGWKDDTTAHHSYAPVDLDMAWDGFGGKTLGKLIREGGEVLALSCGGKYSWDLAHPYDVMFNTRTRGTETWTTGLSMSAYQTFHGIPYLYSISHYLIKELFLCCIKTTLGAIHNGCYQFPRCKWLSNAQILGLL